MQQGKCPGQKTRTVPVSPACRAFKNEYELDFFQIDESKNLLTLLGIHSFLLFCKATTALKSESKIFQTSFVSKRLNFL